MNLTITYFVTNIVVLESNIPMKNVPRKKKNSKQLKLDRWLDRENSKQEK